MNSVPFDPDIKINMSLDEIILLSKGQVNYHLRGRCPKIFKKMKSGPKRGIDVGTSVHSVPLLSSTEGADIYVSKKSPLLNAENKRRIAQAVLNRRLNSNLLEKSKEIIPAKYKLVNTGHGVERVLIPAVGYFFKPLKKKLSPPRKLNNINSSNSFVSKSLQDEPPPLIVAPIYTPHKQSELQEIPMEIDSPDDDIIILSSPNSKKMEVIDVESSFPEDELDAKKVCVKALNSISQTTVQTLNDRFTMLKNIHFN